MGGGEASERSSPYRAAGGDSWPSGRVLWPLGLGGDPLDHGSGGYTQHPAGATDATTFFRKGRDPCIRIRRIGPLTVMAALILATGHAAEQLHCAVSAFAPARAIAMATSEEDGARHAERTHAGYAHVCYGQ